MVWHTTPKDDAWKQVTVRSVNPLCQNLWLRCNHCDHEVVIDAVVFSERSNASFDTPLLLIGQRLRCSKCGEQKSHCWPEPYGVHQRKG